MGGAPSSQRHETPDLANFASQLEVQASIVRLKIKNAEDDARAFARDRNMDGARQRFQSSLLFKKEQAQILRTMNAVHTQTSLLQTNRLNQDAMRVLNSSVRTLHATSVATHDVDMVMSRIHEIGDDTVLNGESLSESLAFGSADDDADFAAFLSGGAAASEPVPKAPPPGVNVASLEVSSAPLPPQYHRAGTTGAPTIAEHNFTI